MLSERGKEWAAFSTRVGTRLKRLGAMAVPPQEGCVREVQRFCKIFRLTPSHEHEVLFQIILYILLASSKDRLTMERDVAQHIETYTVPQYGDKGKDFATTYTPEYCISQIEKYCHRFGSNVREGQEALDFMKMAHFVCLADAKLTEAQEVQNADTV